MTEQYRGHIQEHAAFWTHYRELPFEQRFAEFVRFFAELKQKVEIGDVDLRDAGYALEPGYYDEAIQHNPHGGDMTIVCLRASDLAAGSYEGPEEAKDDWAQVVGIMQKYTGGK